jgi:hypothetical protein
MVSPQEGHIRTGVLSGTSGGHSMGGLRACDTALRDSRQSNYSITSSAVASSVGGSVRPSALAVLRLIANRGTVWVDCWKASLRSADNPSGADLGAIYSPHPNEGGHRKHPRGHSAYLSTNSASGVFCEPRYCSCASCQWGVPKSQKSKRQRSCRRRARTLKIQTV